MKVLTPYIGRREGAPDRPGLLAPERASEPIDGDAEVVLPPALRRERPPPVALGDRFALKPSRTDAAFDDVLMRAGERALAT
jgi:hypothetical protein